MKKTILGASLIVALAISSYGQGTILINNLANTGVQNGNGGTSFNGTTGNPVYSSLVTSNGLIFTTDPAGKASANGYGVAGNAMIGVDFSWALFGGVDAGSVTSLLASQTGAAINGDNFNYGQLQGPSSTFPVPGTAQSATVFLQLFAWEGNTFATYAAALAGGDYAGTSGVFANPSGGGLTPAKALLGLPDVLLTLPVPEPGTMALAGLGGLSMLLFRRKK